MKKIIIILSIVLIAFISWSEVLSASMTDIAKLKPLMGTWEFTCYIFSDPTTNTYTLNHIYNQDEKYYIGGPSAYARYNAVEKNYYLFNDLAMAIYVFNFTKANAVAGTLYPHVPGQIVDISFSFTGIKVAEVSPDPCPASVIYGTDSAETALLRSLRNNVLSQSQEGRELIKLYYLYSPLIVEAMEADADFKADVRALVDGVLGVVAGE